MKLPYYLDKETLTTIDIATYLSVSDQCVRNALKSGKLKAIQLGGKYGKYLVTRENFEEFLKNSNLERPSTSKKAPKPRKYSKTPPDEEICDYIKEKVKQIFNIDPRDKEEDKKIDKIYYVTNKCSHKIWDPEENLPPIKRTNDRNNDIPHDIRKHTEENRYHEIKAHISPSTFKKIDKLRKKDAIGNRSRCKFIGNLLNEFYAD